LKERAKILEGRREEFLFGGCEISLGFGSEHFEGVDDGFRGAEVDLFFPIVGIGNPAEEEPGVLGLENDEFIEPWIRFRHWRHGQIFRVSEKLYKREDALNPSP
jgi:hypothetical protein